LVAYFRDADSPFGGSAASARALAIHGAAVLRERFGADEALERYYADCIASAFQSMELTPPSLRGPDGSFVPPPAPDDKLLLVFGAAHRP
jgi:hypothetical protein